MSSVKTVFPEQLEKNARTKVSLGDVARAAKVSVTSAACALRNLPGVGDATRRRIVEIARRLNYFPDARLASTMAGIRRSTAKDLLPVVWLNANREKDAWHKYSFLSPYMEGAGECFQEQGYRIEEIWIRDPGNSMRRIAQIVESQGIEGVIVTDPARHVRLNWDRLAGVAIGGGLLAPALHRVAMDSNYNLMLSLKSLRRQGYKRIGVCLTEQADRFSHHGARSTILYFNFTIPQSHRVEPLFTGIDLNPEGDKCAFAAWLKRERPDAVVGHSSQMVDWVQSAGFRVPEEMAVAHLAVEDDVLDWAGIYANKRKIGRLAASKLVSLIQQRQFGVPDIASSEFVPGAWRPGRTVLTTNNSTRCCLTQGAGGLASPRALASVSP
jgi:LacI family transcriptional regulator